MDELVATEHDGRQVFRTAEGALYSLPAAPKPAPEPEQPSLEERVAALEAKLHGLPD